MQQLLLFCASPARCGRAFDTSELPSSARGPSLLSPAFIAREGLEEEEVVELRNVLLLRDKQIGHAWAAAALGGGRA